MAGGEDGDLDLGALSVLRALGVEAAAIGLETGLAGTPCGGRSQAWVMARP